VRLTWFFLAGIAREILPNTRVWVIGKITGGGNRRKSPDGFYQGTSNDGTLITIRLFLYSKIIYSNGECLTN
jgi:hypothetical protein